MKRTIEEAGFSPAADEPPAWQLTLLAKLQRCFKCPHAKDGKFKAVCSNCRKSMCPEHTVILCSNCLADIEFFHHFEH